MRRVTFRATHLLGAAFAAVLLCGAPAFGEEKPLSIDEAVRMAVARNIDLRAARFDTGIAEAGVVRSRAIYDPNLTAALQHQEENGRVSPLSSFVERSRSYEADLGASWLLGSGATASVNSKNLWNNGGAGPAGAASSGRSVQPELSLSLSQPLLKGFGREVTERGITVARVGRDAAYDAWRTTAENIAAQARNRFATLVKAREALATRVASLELARRIHAENEARVRAGVLASVELLDSELGVAQREKDLIDAEKAVKDENDRLRVLLQYPGSAEIVPVMSDNVTPVAPEREEAFVRRALDSRPDIRRARALLRSAAFQAKVAENLLLPSLTVNGSAGVFGLAPEAGNAFDQMRRGDSTFWSVGLGFSVPLGNGSARADLAENRLRTSQAKLSLQSLEDAAALEARTAVRGVETGRKQVDVSDKNVKLAEARLASYLKRARVGLATTKDVLQVEADLTSAKQGLSGARADYEVAVTELWRSTGTLLAAYRLEASDREIESSVGKEQP